MANTRRVDSGLKFQRFDNPSPEPGELYVNDGQLKFVGEDGVAATVSTGGGGGLVFSFAPDGAQYDSIATPAQVPGLEVNLTTGVWEYDVRFYESASTNNHNLKAHLGGTCTYSVLNEQTTAFGGLVGTTSVITLRNGATSGSALVINNVSTASYSVQMRGLIDVTADGTFTLLASQNTSSDVDTSEIQAVSIVCRRVGDNIVWE